jgi:hypothetical protein
MLNVEWTQGQPTGKYLRSRPCLRLTRHKISSDVLGASCIIGAEHTLHDTMNLRCDATGIVLRSQSGSCYDLPRGWPLMRSTILRPCIRNTATLPHHLAEFRSCAWAIYASTSRTPHIRRQCHNVAGWYRQHTDAAPAFPQYDRPRLRTDRARTLYPILTSLVRAST